MAILSPLKYLINPAAGYTTNEVPHTTSKSALAIALIDLVITSSSNPSSYRTTSGFMIDPHSSQ